MIVFGLVCFLAAFSSAFSYYDSSHGNEDQISGKNSIGVPLSLQTDYIKCISDKNCMYENSKCVNDKCECRLGYVLDGTLTKCLKVASGYNDKCEESSQCSQHLSVGGVCNKNVCACIDGYHYLNGLCHKSKGLNEKCTNNIECYVNTDYNAAYCHGEEHRCKCKDGFYQREYSTCRPSSKLGENCILDSDCLETYTKCVGNKCVNEHTTTAATNTLPSNNFVLDYHFNITITMTNNSNVEIGSKCKTNNDCSAISHSECGHDQKCTCQRAHFPSADLKYCVPEIGENCVQTEKPRISGSVCSSRGKWSCEYNRASLKNNQLCRKLTMKIGAQCQTKENCQLFGPRSECVAGHCVCSSSSHYVNDKHFCWINKDIGEACQHDYDCYPPNGSPRTVCKSLDENIPGVRVCSCPDGTRPSANGAYCVKNKPELYSYCEAETDCEIENSLCSNRRCQCKLFYFESDGKCLAGLNAFCKADGDCKSENTLCKDGICSCKDNFVGNPSNECVPIVNYHQPCTSDVQCSNKVLNSYCLVQSSEETTEIIPVVNETSPIGICECLPGYHLYDENTCYKMKRLGDVCTRKGECIVEDNEATCRNGICACKSDYVQQNQTCKYTGDGAASIRPWLALLLSTTLFALKSLR